MAERVKEMGPSFYEVIAKHIASAPDPRPSSVIAAYEEKWTDTTAWNRLLHELESLSIKEDDALILEDIQNINLGDRRHLRELLTNFRVDYPMVWWALGYTSPKAILHAKIALGEVNNNNPPLSSKTITLSIISYIRDLPTAQLLRNIKGAVKPIVEREETIISQLKHRSLGKIYWLLTSVNPTYTYKLIKGIYNVLRSDEDDEVLLPFVESTPYNSLTNDDVVELINLLSTEMRKFGIDLPSRPFSTFFRWLWDIYIASITTSSQVTAHGPIPHFSKMWLYPSLFVDEELVEYIVRSYLKHINANGFPYSPFLYLFVHPRYANIWPLLTDYLEKETSMGVAVIGHISLYAHDLGLETIAAIYKDVFLAHTENYNPREFTTNFNGYRRSIEYIVNDIPYAKLLRILTETDYVFLPLSVYHTAIQREQDPVIQHEIANKFVVHMLNRQIIDFTSINSDMLHDILVHLSIKDILEMLPIYAYHQRYEFILKSLLSGEPSLLPPDSIIRNYRLYRNTFHPAEFDKYKEILTLFLTEGRIPPDDVIVSELEKGHLYIMDIIPINEIRRLVASKALQKIPLVVAVRISETTNTPLEDILENRLYSLAIKIGDNYGIWSSITHHASAQADWQTLFSIYITMASFIDKKMLISMITKGADPSYKSSYAILRIITPYMKLERNSLYSLPSPMSKEDIDLLRIIITPKALAKLSPRMREEIKKLLEIPSE